MKTATIKKILLYLVIVFIVVRIWQDPVASARSAGDFLGSVGNFFSNLIDKTSTFIRNLAHGS